MKVTLIDYDKKKREFDIGNVEDIHFADLEVLSGDEVLKVIYKDGSSKVFDSCDTYRIQSYFDDNYTVYMPGVRNLFENEKWLNRKSSYDDSWRGY